MIDLLTRQPIFVVLATVLVLWSGIAWYLQRIDARLRKLEGRDNR